MAEKTVLDKIPENLSRIIAKMCCCMWVVNIFFHFTRNNARNRDHYYFWFREAVGEECWKNLDPQLRESWETGRKSFDSMFGIIRALNKLYGKKCCKCCAKCSIGLENMFSYKEQE